MDVCKELVRQVRSLRRTGKNIIIVFACRTFDLENDPEINSLLIGDEDQRVAVNIGESHEVQVVGGLNHGGHRE